MKKISIIAFLISMPLLACNSPYSQPISSQTNLNLECDDGSMIQGLWQGDSAVLNVDGKKPTLPHVVSGSGARYANSEYELWIKGEQALFIRSQHPDNVIICAVH